MGIMDALNVGMSGLGAAQQSIDITGQNISNANTEGYSRKRVEQQSASVGDDVFGQKGLGVEVTSITRVRNAFLDRQTWEQLGDKGLATQLDAAYTRIENILKEPSADGLNATLNKFWSSWQTLANNPADLSSREAVKSSANVLMDVFHNVSKQIEDFGLSMNNPLSEQAKTVNDITSQIYSLNEKVAGVEGGGPGAKANDSRDQRDVLVRKLSDLVDVQTVEDKQGRVIITSGGNLLVGPSEALKLETYGVDKTLSDGTKSSEIRLRFEGSKKNFEPRSGELKGIMDARSTVLSGYIVDLNALAKAVVTEVNNVHSTGYNLNKNTGVFFFDPSKTTANNIALSDAVLSDSSNISAAAGGKIVDASAFTLGAYGGIPAAASPTFDLKTVPPTSTYQNLVQGSVKITLANGTVLEEGAGKDYVVDYAKGVITFTNYGRGYAGDNATVKLQYNTTGFSGSGNGENALTIGTLQNKMTMKADSAGVFTQSIGGFYSAVVGRLGIEKNQNKSELDTKDFLITQMDNEQNSIAGVSLDEEMTNMIKYENSYKASARYITTISTMLDTLMSLGR